MSNDIFFSICIPTYNRADTLPAAIDSVLSQEYNNYELLIVDNASTDNTTSILNDYSDSRIRKIHNHLTVSMFANHNICIDEAASEWIIFLHSDDTLASSSLNTFYREINKNLDSTMFIPIKGHSQFKSNTLLNGKFGLPNLFKFMTVTPSGCLINRNIIIKNKIRYNDKIIPADLEFCATILNNGLNITLLPDNVVNVGVGAHQYSFNWSRSGEFIFDVSKILKKFIAPNIDIFKQDVKKWQSCEQARLFMFLAYANAFLEIKYIENEISDKSYKNNREYYHVILGRFVGSVLLRFIYKTKNLIKYKVVK